MSDVQAEGLPADEMRTNLENGLNGYMRWPQVDAVMKKARESPQKGW